MMKRDHERLDVYQVSLDFAAWAYELAKQLRTVDRQSREPETVYGYEYGYGYGVQHGPNKPLQPTRAAWPNEKREALRVGPRG